MQARAKALNTGEQPEIVWVCEHDPVYTTGKRGIDNRKTGRLPAPWYAVDRGGETTFHGPGQVMLYPVVNLRSRHLSARHYVHLLEQSVISLLSEYHIKTSRECGLPGVWTQQGKIAAIGVRVSSGIAYHGMALNVHVDTHYFDAIHPCGLTRKAVNMTDVGIVHDPLSVIAKRWMTLFCNMLQHNGEQ